MLECNRNVSFDIYRQKQAIIDVGTDAFCKISFSWVDPTGKPEKELAAMYEQRAQSTEQVGFSRFADTLRMLSQSYLAEAKENMRREQASE